MYDVCNLTEHHTVKDTSVATMIDAVCRVCKKPFSYAVKTIPRKCCSRRCADISKGMFRKDPVARFWRHVSKDNPHGCWLWTSGCFQAGYGCFNRSTLAHRYSYILAHGDPGSAHVLHTCEGNYPQGDVTYRRCVNPAHLTLGDPHENHQDIARTGRGRKKLTGEQATDIRNRHAAGEGAYVLAAAFNVSVPTVYSILQGKTFKYVPGPLTARPTSSVTGASIAFLSADGALKKRFWSKVTKDNPHDCWLWTGCTDKRSGMGHIGIGDEGIVSVHRLSWLFHFGDPGELHVLHECDVHYAKGDNTYRRCVNPDHLSLGTHTDNMQDMASKGRNRKVLSDEIISEILALHASGQGAYTLAQRFGVTPATVYRLLEIDRT